MLQYYGELHMNGLGILKRMINSTALSETNRVNSSSGHHAYLAGGGEEGGGEEGGGEEGGGGWAGWGGGDGKPPSLKNVGSSSTETGMPL